MEGEQDEKGEGEDNCLDGAMVFHHERFDLANQIVRNMRCPMQTGRVPGRGPRVFQ